jgi:hypothetical protein
LRTRSSGTPGRAPGPVLGAPVSMTYSRTRESCCVSGTDTASKTKMLLPRQCAVSILSAMSFQMLGGPGLYLAGRRSFGHVGRRHVGHQGGLWTCIRSLRDVSNKRFV